MAAPAVRIAVRKFLFAEQRAAITQQPHDDWVRLEYCFTFVFGQTFEISSLPVDRGVRLKAVFLPRLKIFDTVPGSGVYDPGALIEGDVIGQHRRDDQIQKRMLEF